MERADESWSAKLVWWVKQSEAERVIRKLRKEIKALKSEAKV